MKGMQLVHGLYFNNLRGDIYGGLLGAGASCVPWSMVAAMPL
jgi:hypothetical protein